MSSSNKVFFHPDKEEIVRMMLNGISVQKIEKWLIEKYPETKEYRVTIPTLQAFRKEHLKLDKESLEKIKKEQISKGFDQRREDRTQDKRTKGKTVDSKTDGDNAIIQSIFGQVNNLPVNNTTNVIKPIVQSSTTYREKISGVGDLNIDVTRKIVELDSLITSRMEYYFNKANEGEEQDTKYDRVLLEYIKQQGELYRDWKRLIEGLAEQNTEASIQLEVVQEHVGIIRETVRDLLNEIDPGLAVRFLENLTDRLNAIEYRHQAIDISGQTKKIEKQIIEVKQEIAKDTTIDEGENNE